MTAEFKRSRAELERLARMYNSDLDAAKAAGCKNPGVLAKLWRKHGIESPCKRRRRRIHEARAGNTALPDYNTQSLRARGRDYEYRD